MRERELVGLAAAVGITAAVVFVFLLAPPPPAAGAGCTAGCPLHAQIAVATPSESSMGGVHLYNFTVQYADGTLAWNMISIAVLSPGGVVASTLVAGWNVTVFGTDGNPVAFDHIQSETPAWTVGGTDLLAAQESILVSSPGASPLGGDTLVLTIASSGSISIWIP